MDSRRQHHLVCPALYKLSILPLLCFILFSQCRSDDESDWYLNEDRAFEWKDTIIADSPSKRYGLRWKTDDLNDAGERCFDAVGMQAHFGVGKTLGKSHFDKVYPWNQIRRCNVIRQDETTEVIYDDDPRFAVDGSNGDVFVRIPKFYVEKYCADGYEYRVVSGRGDHPHPAFVEDGFELDAVYVSAFEGYIGPDSLMYSIAGVIPTSNMTAQQFLDAARRRGPQYSLYDMRTVDMLYTLAAVEFGCRNTSSVMGYGISHYRQPIEAAYDTDRFFYAKRNAYHSHSIATIRRPHNQIIQGSCICICKGNQRNILTFAHCTSIVDYVDETVYTFDGPPVDITTDCFIGNCAQQTNWIETCRDPHFGASGRANMMERYFHPRERNPMRYRWMENLIGNLWHFLPDVTLFNHQLYLCSSMSDYRIGCHDGSYEPFGNTLAVNLDNGDNDNDWTGVNHWVTSLIADSLVQGVSFGESSTTSINSCQAFGAYYYVGDGLCVLVNGGGFDHRNRCNLLTTRAWDSPDVRWHLYGARLIFKDIPAQ